MFENLVAEQKYIEQLKPGDELLEYLQSRFGWKFRRTVAQDIPAVSSACRQVWAEKTDAQRYLNELIFHLNRYVIKDFFENHPTRKAFFQNVLGKHDGWLKKQSKLSASNWNRFKTS